MLHCCKLGCEFNAKRHIFFFNLRILVKKQVIHNLLKNYMLSGEPKYAKQLLYEHSLTLLKHKFNIFVSNEVDI